MKKLLLLIFLLPLLMMAQVPDPLPGTYVNDNSGTLSLQDIGEINMKINALEKKYTVQLAVVIVDRLPENLSIEEYAMQVGRKWHVGKADNGLVYVLSLSQRKQRLEVARNLEGTIPDIAASKILDNMKPLLKSKDYKNAILRMIADIDDQLVPVQAEQKALINKPKEENTNGYWFLLLIPVIGGLLIWLTTRKPRPKKQQVDNNLADCGYGTKRQSVQRANQRNDDLIYNQSKGRHPRTGESSPSFIPIVIPDPTPSYSPPPDTSYTSSPSPDFGSTSSSADSGFSGGGATSDF